MTAEKSGVGAPTSWGLCDLAELDRASALGLCVVSGIADISLTKQTTVAATNPSTYKQLLSTGFDYKEGRFINRVSYRGGVAWQPIVQGESDHSAQTLVETTHVDHGDIYRDYITKCNTLQRLR